MLLLIFAALPLPPAEVFGQSSGSARAVQGGYSARPAQGAGALSRVQQGAAQGVRPGQGMASSAAFMRATGCIEAVASLMLYPVHFVTPQCWKKHHGLIKAPKAASLAMARAMWPTAGLKLAMHHGRAEALLMAQFGLETLE